MQETLILFEIFTLCPIIEPTHSGTWVSLLPLAGEKEAVAALCSVH